MSPEYLKALADFVDPGKLWKHGSIRFRVGSSERMQVDSGVALRRYAMHIESLERAMEKEKSVLITPLTSNSSARLEVPTPQEHERLRVRRRMELRAGKGMTKIGWLTQAGNLIPLSEAYTDEQASIYGWKPVFVEDSQCP